jgi:hypothetical protein
MTCNDKHYDHDHRMTRRSAFIGAAASLICAPTIVRAASLMPVRSLIIPMTRQLPVGPQYAGFCQRLMYQSLDSNVRAGRMTTALNGKIISEADARRMIAHAQAQGWLPPEAV